MVLSERDRRALIMGGLALAVLAGYFLVQRPAAWYRGMIRAHETAAGAYARMASEERKAEYLAAEIKEWEEKAGELLPPKPYSEQITTIVERIFSAAQESGVQLQGVTPGAATAWPNEHQVQQAVIQIEAQAGWENVFKCIGGLYRIPGVVSIEKMDLTGEKGGGNLKVRLSVSVLVAPTSENRWAS